MWLTYERLFCQTYVGQMSEENVWNVLCVDTVQGCGYQTFWHARLQKSSKDDSSTKYRSTVISLFLHFSVSLVSPYFVTLVITATHTPCLSAPPGRLDSLRPTGAKRNHNYDQKWLSSFFHVFNRLIINNINKIAVGLKNICKYQPSCSKIQI